MVDYLKAFERPFSGDKYIFLKAIIPIYNLAVFGYIIECIKNTWQGKDELPDWKKSSWLDKIILIFKTAIMPLIYFGIPFLIPIIIVFIYLKEINAIIPYLAYVILGILFLLMSYYSLAVIISYIKNWRTEDIKYSRINKIIFSGKYFASWLVSFVLLSIMSYLTQLKISHWSWFSVVIYWIFQLTSWTIIAESIREIEKEKRL